MKKNYNKLFLVFGNLVVFIGAFLPFINVSGNNIYYYDDYLGMALICSSLSALLFIKLKKPKMIFLTIIIQTAMIVIFLLKTSSQLSINEYLPGFAKMGPAASVISMGIACILLGLAQIICRNKKD